MADFHEIMYESLYGGFHRSEIIFCSLWIYNVVAKKIQEYGKEILCCDSDGCLIHDSINRKQNKGTVTATNMDYF